MKFNTTFSAVVEDAGACSITVAEIIKGNIGNNTSFFASIMQNIHNILVHKQKCNIL